MSGIGADVPATPAAGLFGRVNVLLLCLAGRKVHHMHGVGEGIAPDASLRVARSRYLRTIVYRIRQARED